LLSRVVAVLALRMEEVVEQEDSELEQDYL
jgi:hypothetical protein